MKRIIALFYALGLIFSLCACSGNIADTPTDTVAPSEAVTQTQPITADEPSAPPIVLKVPYSYGNMQKNIPSGNFMPCGEKVLFLLENPEKNRSFLYAYSMTTGKVSLFCKDMGCTHVSVKCPAYGAQCNLEQYDGEMYAAKSGGSIKRLQNGRFEEIISGSADCFWHANGKLYVKTVDNRLLEYEMGSETPRTLLEEYTAYWNVAFENCLYGCDSRGIIRVDLQAPKPQIEVLVEDMRADISPMIDGKHIYYVNKKEGGYLYRCDMDGSKAELLIEQPILPASMNFDDAFFYFRLFTDEKLAGTDCRALYRFPKNDPAQVEKIAELPEIVYQVFTVPDFEKIFVTAITHGEDEQELHVYVMGKDGSDPQLLALPDF